jgi:hypothetical protein
VNHLPFVTALDVAGDDGFAMLLVLDAPRPGAGRCGGDPDGSADKHSEGPGWTKGDILRNWRVKLELFDHFEVLPGSWRPPRRRFFDSSSPRRRGGETGGDRAHLHCRPRARRGRPRRRARAMLVSAEVDSMPGEMVAPVIQCLLSTRRVGSR